MTIRAFAEKHNKEIRLVKQWIRKEFIPGASLEENYIPDSARVPYTCTRARKGDAILQAILKACKNEYGITSKLFKISPERFEAMLFSLESEGLLLSYESDGIRYYDITTKGKNSLKSFRKSDWISLGIILATLAPTLLQLFQVLPK